MLQLQNKRSNWQVTKHVWNVIKLMLFYSNQGYATMRAFFPKKHKMIVIFFWNLPFTLAAISFLKWSLIQWMKYILCFELSSCGHRFSISVFEVFCEDDPKQWAVDGQMSRDAGRRPLSKHRKVESQATGEDKELVLSSHLACMCVRVCASLHCIETWRREWLRLPRLISKSHSRTRSNCQSERAHTHTPPHTLSEAFWFSPGSTPSFQLTDRRPLCCVCMCV